MNIDFTNPVFMAVVDGVSIKDIFGGIKPNGWITRVEVVLELGKASSITIEINPPYEDAIKLIDSNDFYSPERERLIDCRFGYLPDVWSRVFTFNLNKLPEVNWGSEISITYGSIGAGKMFVNSVLGNYYRKSLYDIIIKRYSNLKMKVYKVKDSKSFEEMIESFNKKNKKKVEKHVFVLDGDGEYSLDMIGADDFSYSEAEFREMLERYGYEVIDYDGKRIDIINQNKSLEKKPVAKLIFRNKFDVSKNEYPLESFSISSNTRILYSPFRNGCFYYKIDRDKGSVKKVTKKPADSKAPAGNKEKHLAENKESDGQFVSVDLGSDGDKILQNEIDETRMVKCSLTPLYGLPHIIPGDLIELDCGSKRLNGIYQIRKHTISFDGQLNSEFEAIRSISISGNVNKNKSLDGNKIIKETVK